MIEYELAWQEHEEHGREAAEHRAAKRAREAERARGHTAGKVLVVT